MTDIDIAKIKEAAERMDLSWHQCDVTVGGSPLIIMQASAYIQMCAPHTILALIARLEAAETNLATATEALLAIEDGDGDAGMIARQTSEAITASGTVSTTQYDGTLYAVVTTSATSPGASSIRALLKDKPNG